MALERNFYSHFAINHFYKKFEGCRKGPRDLRREAYVDEKFFWLFSVSIFDCYCDYIDRIIIY